MAAVKTSATAMPNVQALEVFLDEAAEACQEMVELRRKLRRKKPGSEPYFDQLPDIAVSAVVIGAKVKELVREIDAIEDAMPDEDDD